MNSQTSRLMSHLGINLRFALGASLWTLLAMSWSVNTQAQQSTSPGANPVPPAQSAPEPVPSTQTQTPDSSTNQTQTPTPTPTLTPASAKPRRLTCRQPANPNKRRTGCKDEDFAWGEALTKDWNGARAELKKLGITPSASYYSALQTNLSGGPHQIWGYTGQLITAVNFDFQKLLKIPGMSLYFSDSWGTGSNLTATINSVFPVNIDYAVGAYLGEIYLQQKFLKNDLTVAAGRLAASYSFADLPVFDNYVSLAVNPNPVALASNDFSYTGPPPGLEWGAQAVYDITPVPELSTPIQIPQTTEISSPSSRATRARSSPPK